MARMLIHIVPKESFIRRTRDFLHCSLTDFNQPNVSDLLIKNGINKNKITLISYSRILVTASCSGDPRVLLVVVGMGEAGEG